MQDLRQGQGGKQETAWDEMEAGKTSRRCSDLVWEKFDHDSTQYVPDCLPLVRIDHGAAAIEMLSHGEPHANLLVSYPHFRFQHASISDHTTWHSRDDRSGPSPSVRALVAAAVTVEGAARSSRKGFKSDGSASHWLRTTRKGGPRGRSHRRTSRAETPARSTISHVTRRCKEEKPLMSNQSTMRAQASLDVAFAIVIWASCSKKRGVK